MGLSLLSQRAGASDKPNHGLVQAWLKIRDDLFTEPLAYQGDFLTCVGGTGGHNKHVSVKSLVGCC